MAGGIDRTAVYPDLDKSIYDLAGVLSYLRRQKDALQADHDDMARAINETVDALTPAAGVSYAVTNVTTDRTVDANATTVDELADLVGTLISDLHARGII